MVPQTETKAGAGFKQFGFVRIRANSRLRKKIICAGKKGEDDKKRKREASPEEKTTENKNAQEGQPLNTPQTNENQNEQTTSQAPIDFHKEEKIKTKPNNGEIPKKSRKRGNTSKLCN
jgi:hypothetical protein